MQTEETNMATTLDRPSQKEIKRPSRVQRAHSPGRPTSKVHGRKAPNVDDRSRPSQRRHQRRGRSASSSKTDPRFQRSSHHAGRYQPNRRSKTRLGRFFHGFSLEKFFTFVSFLVAAAILVLCTLDLAIAWPWKHARPFFDWTYLGVSVTMIWLCYDVFKDQSRR
ncbi:hypothetical protein Rcae01_04128 [Novipirellula caenicola]|uniref:Uncharacterized protein n=1 Tax=Novipirellula caenicola TaxID=1536901 RepID=A0ABP9VV20_9BACT